jgi:hypothetical protein
MRKTAIIMAVALLAAVLTGCGGDKGDKNKAAQAADTTDTAAVATDTAVAVADTVASAPDTAAAVQSWKSGKTTVTLKDGILTVSGKGAIMDYCLECDRPWYSSNESATKLVIEAGVTSIGETAFMGFASLTSVTIPNSVTVIGDDAFGACTSLTSVTIPNGVTSIGLGAFADCINLTSITIPGSVKNISELAFFQSSKLTSINVAPDNANYSSEDGVLFNKNKTALLICPQGKNGAYTIPKTVTKLGEIAFKECRGLTSITCLNPIPPNANVESFWVSSGVCLYVPENSLTAYRDAERWKYDFKCIKAIESAPE